MRRQGPNPCGSRFGGRSRLPGASGADRRLRAGFARRIAPQGRKVRVGRVRAIGMQAPGLSHPFKGSALGSSAAELEKIPERTFSAGAGLRQIPRPARRSGFEAAPPHLPIRPPCYRRPPRSLSTACTLTPAVQPRPLHLPPRNSALTSHADIVRERRAPGNGARGCHPRFLCIRRRKLHSSSPSFSTAVIVMSAIPISDGARRGACR